MTAMPVRGVRDVALVDPLDCVSCLLVCVQNGQAYARHGLNCGEYENREGLEGKVLRRTALQCRTVGRGQQIVYMIWRLGGAREELVTVTTSAQR